MNLPASPKTPAWLQFFQWVTNPVKYMETAVQQYPDIFNGKIVGKGKSIVFVNHPEAIQQLLTHDTKEFSAPGEVNEILRPLVGDHSVILLEGDRHKRQRKLLMPPFHGERMRAYGNLIGEVTQKAMSPLKPGETFIARPVMQEISLQVILQAVFGLYEGERYQQIKQGISNMLEVFRVPLTSSLLFFPFLQKDLGAWSPWGRMRRQQQKIDELLYAEIEDRRQNPDSERTDILSLLMSARDEEGKPMTDIELRDELLTLLFAGHETTATAMAWGLYWIHSNPKVKEKLLQELDSLGENPEPTEVAKLPYLNAVCNETLRLYPVAMLTFPRVVEEPAKLLGYDLEPGTMVVGCIYLAHHREDIYPDSYQFKPERFLERSFSAYEFLPFGAGVRRCIGAALAVYEMKLALATILSNYSLELAETKPVLPQRRGVTISPTGGVKMKLNGKRDKSFQVSEAVLST